MTDAQFTTICTAMRQDIADRTPHDTGNLADKATLVVPGGMNEMRIFVNENIAPYFRAVNERPSYYVNSIYGGKVSRPNRNYMYFERAFVSALRNLADSIDGEVIQID